MIVKLKKIWGLCVILCFLIVSVLFWGKVVEVELEKGWMDFNIG